MIYGRKFVLAHTDTDRDKVLFIYLLNTQVYVLNKNTYGLY